MYHALRTTPYFDYMNDLTPSLLADEEKSVCPDAAVFDTTNSGELGDELDQGGECHEGTGDRHPRLLGTLL